MEEYVLVMPNVINGENWKDSPLDYMEEYVIVGVAQKNVSINRLKDMSTSNGIYKTKSIQDKSRYFAYMSILGLIHL